MGFSFFVESQPTESVDLRRSPAAFSDPLGTGLVRPFRRTERGDFATASGEPLVGSCVGQVLGTEENSLPWRPEFGSRLYLLRHAPIDVDVTPELARVYAEEALRRWEPRARIGGCRVAQPTPGDRSTLRVFLDWRIGDDGKYETLKLEI